VYINAKKNLQMGTKNSRILIWVLLLFLTIFYRKDLYHLIIRNLKTEKIEVRIVNDKNENLSSNYANRKLKYEQKFNGEKIEMRYYSYDRSLTYNVKKECFDFYLPKSDTGDSIAYQLYLDSLYLGEFTAFYQFTDREKLGNFYNLESDSPLERIKGVYHLKIKID
jgi:hypothetical protein